MPIKRIEELDKQLELVENVTNKGIKTITQQYEKIKNKPIENLDDFQELMKLNYTIIRYIKSLQKVIRERIKLLDDDWKKSNWKTLYLELEENKAMFTKSMELLNKKFELYKYEPEKLAEAAVQEELNLEFVEQIKNWVEQINKYN